MIQEPIYQGLLQSDLDCAGFSLLNQGGETGGGTEGGDITQLTSGRDYIEVTFDDTQEDALWEFTRLQVTNTVDFAPVNIWPGLVSAKSTSGFRVQLNDVPDSSNYYLHWGFTGTGGGSSGITDGYTIVDTTVSGDTSRIIVPNSRVAGTAIVYCHGLGESDPTSYFDPTSSDKELYMADALGAGYMLACGNYGGDNWSNATAQTKVEALVAYLVLNYGVSHVVMWGQSAGGPLSLLKSTQGFTGVTVSGWFGIYPVVDLDVAHSTTLTASINAAFPAYPADAVGRDPIDLAASAYDGLRLDCCGSTADTIVPSTPHGVALVTLTSNYATEVACIATSGDHGDASNFTQVRVDDFVAFLNRCF